MAAEIFAVEHENSEAPQFSADLFAGPCFGDLTPSEVDLSSYLNPFASANADIQSSLATLPDAPSPSPLLLTSLVESAGPPSPEIGDLIDFTPTEENTSELLLPSINGPPKIQLFDPANGTSLMDSSPVHDTKSSKSLHTSSQPIDLFDGRSDVISPPHFDDSPHDSSTLICLDEEILVPEPSIEPREDLIPNPSKAEEMPFLDLMKIELPILNESLPIETINLPSNQTTFFNVPNPQPFMLDDSLTTDGETANLAAHLSNAVSPDPPSPELTMLDESFSRTDPVALQIDSISDENADMLPSSSPADERSSSPQFPSACSSSPSSLDAIDPSTVSKLSCFPLTAQYPIPHPSNTSDPLIRGQFEPIDLATHSLPSVGCSSPPSSSPRTIFSSSPPPASDSSVPPEQCILQEELESTTDMFADGTDLSPLSPVLIPIHLESDPASLNLDFPELPPSSSPLLPSSRQSDALQTMEAPEQPRSLDETLLIPKLEREEVLPSAPILQAATSDSSGMDVDMSRANDETALEPSVTLGKRKREEEEAKLNASQVLKGQEAREESSTQPPNPKRPTLASQKLQRKMLAKPFRSPAMRPKAAEPAPPPPAAVKKEPPPSEQLLAKAMDSDLKKHRTQRAAGQFKSPLSLAAAGSVPTAVRQTPTIQTLERKVQVLKRAVKVRKEGEEETLEGLVRKWTEAGREVAYEVWDLVKDGGSGGGGDWGSESQSASSSSGKRRFEDSWGWNEDSGSKRVKVEDGERNWGWDVSPTAASSDQDQDHQNEPSVESSPEDEEKPRDTLGTMLMRLGIAPSTLGWNDEEGEFVDE